MKKKAVVMQIDEQPINRGYYPSFSRIHLAPVSLCQGRRQFENIGVEPVKLERTNPVEKSKRNTSEVPRVNRIKSGSPKS